MRCRTSAWSANRTICCTSSLPPSSAGCALPAMTSWIGRSGSSSSALSRSGSRIISVRRLYDGTRRAKPMVSTSGSNTDEVQPSSASVARAAATTRAGGGGPRRRGARAARGGSPRWRCRRPWRCAPSPGASVVIEVPISRSASSKTSRATQVGACTPLVTDEIGTSAASKPGQRPLNISRLTMPCSCDPVGALGEAQAHVRHVEDRGPVRRRARGPGRAAHRDRVPPAKYPGDEVLREAVDAGRDRGVGREDGAGPDGLEGLVVGQALGDELADPLDAQEAGVALVGVEHLGLGVAGQRGVGADRPHPADAEQQLLARGGGRCRRRRAGR